MFVIIIVSTIIIIIIIIIIINLPQWLRAGLGFSKSESGETNAARAPALSSLTKGVHLPTYLPTYLPAYLPTYLPTYLAA